eukprot:NODE_21630_length_743_cov_13.628247.p2 GENE.NODE_21630_length_743_cov_13.628247~~NODE_21630_length_743_cov_13.628247.p2  ORF type:complete len:85 (-),score=6.22 NODE_21630_length_743_cov_13.628247:283-537(-)
MLTTGICVSAGMLLSARRSAGGKPENRHHQHRQLHIGWRTAALNFAPDCFQPHLMAWKLRDHETAQLGHVLTPSRTRATRHLGK